MRVVYCLVLFVIFAYRAYGSIFYYDERSVTVNGINMLAGVGGEVFFLLLAMQYIALLLIMPAVMAGVVTREKERGSLVLLFLTPVKPWRIILEKYLSRMVPVISLQLLTLPLAAVLYSTGGISMEDLFYDLSVIISLSFFIGAYSIMFSSYCRTTANSYISSYLTTILLAAVFVVTMGYFKLRAAVPFPVFLLLMAGMTVICLLAAKYFLLRRAFLSRGNAALNVSKIMDRIINRFNKLIGGVVLIKEKQSIPGRDAVAWLEKNRRSFGKGRFALRYLLVLILPPVLSGFFALLFPEHVTSGTASLMLIILCVVWLILTFIVVNVGCGAIAGEKSNQTLDVLLTTPIYGRDIVEQKMQGINGLLFILWTPFTVFTYVVLLMYIPEYFSSSYYSAWLKDILMLSPLLTFLNMRFLIWLSLWVGLMAKSRLFAIIISLCFVALIQIFGPLPVLFLFGGDRSCYQRRMDTGEIIVLSFMLAGAYFILTALIKNFCRKNADSLLGRLKPPRGNFFNWLAFNAALGIVLSLIWVFLLGNKYFFNAMITFPFCAVSIYCFLYKMRKKFL